ncbi:MAG TPA: hypothetical protein VFW33_09080, partial [Gemmataceae bacterium]|nr:hypothetical protein [Gemmataceae bacterium]
MWLRRSSAARSGSPGTSFSGCGSPQPLWHREEPVPCLPVLVVAVRVIGQDINVGVGELISGRQQSQVLCDAFADPVHDNFAPVKPMEFAALSRDFVGVGRVDAG